MTPDLTKLPAAPWSDGGPDNFGDGWTHCLMAGEDLIATADCDFPHGKSHTSGLPECERARAVVAFAVLARNALDVMTRRGWGVAMIFNGQWGVLQGKQGWPTAADPFTALVEADRWYKANVEVG